MSLVHKGGISLRSWRWTLERNYPDMPPEHQAALGTPLRRLIFMLHFSYCQPCLSRTLSPLAPFPAICVSLRRPFFRLTGSGKEKAERPTPPGAQGRNPDGSLPMAILKS